MSLQSRRGGTRCPRAEESETMARIAALVLTTVPLAAFPFVAQVPPKSDLVKSYVPLHRPTAQELDHIQALKLYGLACIHERNNRLIEAMHTLEEAVRLDPKAAPIYRALIPLY